MPYGIDAELCNKGRRFAGTKRRVKFSFGFGNRDAIERGLSSAECRGEEHQVVMIWSLTSGKQRVLADGIEVHFSRHSVTNKFECQWTMKSGHQVTVVGAWAPLAKDIRNFDLRIDGLSFWDMPKIFQLGNSGGRKGASTSTSMPPRRRTVASESSTNTPAAQSTSSCASTSTCGSLSDSLSQGRKIAAPLSSPLSVSQTAVWDDLLSAPLPVPACSLKSHELPPCSTLTTTQHANPFATDSENDVTPMERALKSLVNMDAWPSQSSCMSRSPSTSDLSVQSAYASTHPTGHYASTGSSNQLSFHTSYTMCGWPNNQNQWPSHPVYTFAG